MSLMSENLETWLEKHKNELMDYPCHYLLIGMTRGIICSGTSREDLVGKIEEMFAGEVEFTEEELQEPTYIVSTMLMDKGKWADA